MTTINDGERRWSPFDLFQWLTPDALSAADRAARTIAVPARGTIYRQSDPGEAMYRIVRGTVRLSVMRGDGRELLYQLFEPGGCFGTSSLVDGEAAADRGSARGCRTAGLRSRLHRRSAPRASERRRCIAAAAGATYAAAQRLFRGIDLRQGGLPPGAEADRRARFVRRRDRRRLHAVHPDLAERTCADGRHFAPDSQSDAARVPRGRPRRGTSTPPIADCDAGHARPQRGDGARDLAPGNEGSAGRI